MSVNSINNIINTTDFDSIVENDTVVNGELFKNMIYDSLNDIQELEEESNQLIENYIVGEADIQDVMLSLEDMQVTLETTIEIRNKLIEAFNELKNIQL